MSGLNLYSCSNLQQDYFKVFLVEIKKWTRSKVDDIFFKIYFWIYVFCFSFISWMICFRQIGAAVSRIWFACCNLSNSLLSNMHAFIGESFYLPHESTLKYCRDVSSRNQKKFLRPFWMRENHLWSQTKRCSIWWFICIRRPGVMIKLVRCSHWWLREGFSNRRLLIIA